MITSTGNNFGGGAISFKAVDKEEYLVLNGIVEIDTEESEYQDASVLEIYVPDLRIPKSLETLVYLARNKNGFNTMILAKTWIGRSFRRHRTAWDSTCNYRLHRAHPSRHRTA